MRTNRSRVLEKGHGSYFELCHDFLNGKTTNEIKLHIWILNFSFLGPTIISRVIEREGITFLFGNGCTVSEDEYDTPSNEQYWNGVNLTGQNLT